MNIESLIEALPPGDRSIAPRDLLDVLRERRAAGGFMNDRAELLDFARARTARRQLAMAREERDESRKITSKPSREAAFNRRLTLDLVAALRPDVTALRRACFGSEEPPCKSLEEACAWIEERSVDRFSVTRAERDHEARFVSEFSTVCDRANREDRWLVYHYGYQPLSVEYWGSDGAVKVRRIEKNVEPLHSIVGFVRSVAEVTMLPAAGLMAFVLTGAGPGERVRLDGSRSAVLSGLSVLAARRLHVGEQVVIQIDRRELTDRNLRLLRQYATAPSGAVRQKRLTVKQQRALEVVERLGPPPAKKFEGAYWRRVARELRMDNPVATARLYERARLQQIATESRTGRSKHPQLREGINKNARKSSARKTRA